MEPENRTATAQPLGLRALRAAGVTLRRAGDLVLPRACAACRRPVGGEGLCGACWARLTFIERPYCERLGTPFSYDPGDDRVSAEARENPPAYDRARGAVLFGDVARDLVHGLKYTDRQDLARPMARMMARAGASLLSGADAIVPVPLHRLRLWRRRFNQSAALGRLLARDADVAFRPEWLERTRSTPQQVGRSRSERVRNVQGAFDVPEACRTDIAGRRIVLVDDVLTTGATLEACARTLRRAGAARIDVLVFARVVDGV